MSYRIDFTQKKNGTFLVAASAGVGANLNEYPERFQAVPLESAEAFMRLLKTAGCSKEIVAALTEAAAKAAGSPDSPVVCRPLDFENDQLAHLGLSGAGGTRGSVAA